MLCDFFPEQSLKNYQRGVFVEKKYSSTLRAGVVGFLGTKIGWMFFVRLEKTGMVWAFKSLRPYQCTENDGF